MVCSYEKFKAIKKPANAKALAGLEVDSELKFSAKKTLTW